MDNIEGDIDNLEEKILITTSCKASVKANTKLSIWQMQDIIKNGAQQKCHTHAHTEDRYQKSFRIKNLQAFSNVQNRSKMFQGLCHPELTRI